MCCFSPILLLCQTFVWNAAAPLMRPLSAILSLILRSLVGHEPLMRADSMSLYFHLLFQVPIFVGGTLGENWSGSVSDCLLDLFPRHCLPSTHPPARPHLKQKTEILLPDFFERRPSSRIGKPACPAGYNISILFPAKGVVSPSTWRSVIHRGTSSLHQCHPHIDPYRHRHHLHYNHHHHNHTFNWCLWSLARGAATCGDVYSKPRQHPPDPLFLPPTATWRLFKGNFFQSIRFDSLSKLLFFIGDMPRKINNICLQILAKSFPPTPPDLTHLLFPRLHCKPSPAPGPSCLLPSCQVSSYRDSVTPNTTKYALGNLHRRYAEL